MFTRVGAMIGTPEYWFAAQVSPSTAETVCRKCLSWPEHQQRPNHQVDDGRQNKKAGVRQPPCFPPPSQNDGKQRQPPGIHNA
jgi:hypothetical protein